MKSVICMLLASLLFCSMASGRETLKIGCLQGGIGEDIFFEILTRACKELEIRCLRVNWPSERTLAKAEANMIDGDGPRNPAIEKYYPKLVRVDFNFFDVEFVGFSARSEVSLNSWKDLEGHWFSYLRGWKIFDLNTPTEKRRIFNNTDDLIKNVLNPTPVRPTEIFLITKWNGFDLIKKYGAQKQIKLLPGVLETKPQYLYLSPRNKALAHEFVKVLNNMKASGKIQKIIDNALKQRLGFIP